MTDRRRAGRCQELKDVNPGLWEAFFADRSMDRKPAKEVCEGCPARLDCLRDALENQEIWGVWGGCDEVDIRRALSVDTNGVERSRSRTPRCPACLAGISELGTRFGTHVECGRCLFTWEAGTSVRAVEAYARASAAEPVADVVPIRPARPARVRVPRGKIPSGAPSRDSRVPALRGPESPQTGDVVAIAASGRRRA